MSSIYLVCLFLNGRVTGHFQNRGILWSENLPGIDWREVDLLPINPVQNSKGAESLISTQPFWLLNDFKR